MEKLRKAGLWPTVVMVGALAVLFGSLVTAGPETYQGGDSWPHGTDVGGQPAIERLRWIHDKAIDALPGATGAEKNDIIRVLKAAFTCAAYDGIAPTGNPPPPTLPDHASMHAEAAAKIQAAWDALHMPPDATHQQEWQNWAVCADNLEHGHEE